MTDEAPAPRDETHDSWDASANRLTPEALTRRGSIMAVLQRAGAKVGSWLEAVAHPRFDEAAVAVARGEDLGPADEALETQMDEANIAAAAKDEAATGAAEVAEDGPAAEQNPEPQPEPTPEPPPVSEEAQAGAEVAGKVIGAK